MNTITITSGDLVVEPKALDRLWALRKEVRIPLSAVTGATFDPNATSMPKGIRAPGLGLPWKWAGTFYRDQEKHFWNAAKGENTIVISAKDAEFDRVFVSVKDPRAVVDAINAAVAERRAA